VHPHRSVLSRVLGTEAIVKIDEFVTDVRPGDVLLICSDGLSGMVADVMIGKILADPDPEAAARRLIEAAKAGGGYDNITAIVVRFDDGQAASDDALGELAEETSRIEAAADEGDSAGDPDDGPAGTVDGAAGTADQLSLGVDAPGVVELAPGEQASLDLMTVSGKRARSRVFRRLALSVAVLGLVVVLGVTGVVVVNTCYFIGNDDGLLVVYSGLPVSVGPVDLYAVAYGSSRTYSSLTEQQRRLVDERDVRSQNAALQLGDRLGMWP
jgi:PPM family protein phosphatase